MSNSRMYACKSDAPYTLHYTQHPTPPTPHTLHTLHTHTPETELIAQEYYTHYRPPCTPVCVCARAHARTRVRVCVCASVCVRAYVHVWICVCVCVCVCVDICMYMQVHTIMCAYTYRIYMLECTKFPNIYVCICMYTQ